jgi:hypothetical protein
MRIAALVGGLCCLLVSMASAQPAIESCDFFAWDYEPHPTLSGFMLYVGRQSGVYDIPLLPVPSYPDLTRRVSCATVAVLLPGRGTWYAALVAEDLMGGHSDFSDELSFTYGGATGSPPPRPPVPPLPPPPTGTFPPIVPVRPPVAKLPPLPSGSGGILDTCAWRGTCPPTQPQVPARTLPPPRCPSTTGNVTETDLWRGHCP